MDPVWTIDVVCSTRFPVTDAEEDRLAALVDLLSDAPETD